MKQLLRFLDYFFVLRPVLFLPAWAVFLSGHYVQQNYTSGTAVDSSHSQLLWIGLAVTLMVGATAILKQIRDRQSATVDEHVPYIIADGFLTTKAGFIEAMTLSALSILIGIIFSPLMAIFLLLLLIVAGYLYCFSPFVQTIQS